VTRWSRRQIVQGMGAAGLGLLAGCGRLPWQAQPAARIPRIGFLSAGLPSASVDRVEAFRQALRELGYVEGENVVIEYRYAEGTLDRVSELAAELVRLPVDVILAGAPTPTRAAKEATSTMPIVMAYETDPVGNGFIASLARPGGNITGLSSLAPGISGKQLELLQAIVPGLSRVAVLGTSLPGGYADLALDPRSKELELAAGALGVQLQYSDVRSLEDIEPAFGEARREHVDAAVVFASPILEAHRTRVADLAVQHRLPTVYHVREFVEAGGLMCYGVSFIGLYRRAATYVDRILKGAKPADLPIERPREFEFVINLRTAQALGLTIPPHVLLQATEVIQ
jgi:putative tryptophan/tyrosine transport system substrate-binding protein